MKETKIDTLRIITAGLHAIGFNLNKRQVEVILQISDYLRENPDATLKDVLQKEKNIRAIIKRDEQSKKE